MNPKRAGLDPIIAAIALSKVYRRGREAVRALDRVTFEIRSGEFVAIVGPSGSGKTTLLNLIGCMDAPSEGTLLVAGRDARRLSEGERTRLRREQIGFVFQHFGLIPTLTVAENIALPAFFARRPLGRRLEELLEKVGLAHRRQHRPHQLSGGEMQRVAVARALINEPKLLLADEPTGNLDSQNGEAVIELLRGLHREGVAVCLVTHDPRFARYAERTVPLLDGRLAEAPSDGNVPSTGR